MELGIVTSPWHEGERRRVTDGSISIAGESGALLDGWPNKNWKPIKIGWVLSK